MAPGPSSSGLARSGGKDKEALVKRYSDEVLLKYAYSGLSFTLYSEHKEYEYYDDDDDDDDDYDTEGGCEGDHCEYDYYDDEDSHDRDADDQYYEYYEETGDDKENSDNKGEYYYYYYDNWVDVPMRD